MKRGRQWLLTRQCQLTLQLSCGILVASLFTVVSQLHFAQACLTAVFVILSIGSLAFDQHIGTRLQVSAWMLGPMWLAGLLAGTMMTVARLVSSSPSGSVAATCVLAVAGLAMLVFLKASAPPGAALMMSLLTIVLYGIMVVVSLLYPSLPALWLHAVGLVSLALVIGAVTALLIGFLVLPSLASDEVVRLTAEALQGAGTILSYHTSLLLSDDHIAGGGIPTAKTSWTSAAPRTTHPTGTRKRQQGGTVAQAAVVPDKPAAAGANSVEHASANNSALKEHGTRQTQQQQSSLHTHQLQPAGVGHRPLVPPRGVSSHRSSIKLAAAGAAVVAASEQAHKAAAEAAAATLLSWVDAPGASVSGNSQPSSSMSLHSTQGSDAGAEVAAHAAAGQHEQEQQQHDGDDSSESHAGNAHGSTRLTEELLQQHQQASGLTVTTEAWAAAAAAMLSRQGSLCSSAVTSEGPCPSVGEHAGARAAAAAAAAALKQAHQQQTEPHHVRFAPQQDQRQRSLETAASLDFMEEMDDKAFLAMCRVLSQASLQQQQQAAAVSSKREGPPSTASNTAAVDPGAGSSGRGLLRHSKPATSRLSTMSVAGSTVVGDAGEDGHEVPARQQAPSDVAEPESVFVTCQVPSGSTAGSIISTQVHPVPQQASSASIKQQQQDGVAISHAASLQQQRSSSKSYRRLPSFGFGSWPSLRQPLEAQSSSPLAGQGAHGSSRFASAKTAAGASRSHKGALQDSPSTSIPSTQPMQPPLTAAQLNPLIGRAKTALASARLEPAWLRPRGCGLVPFDADAFAQLLDDVELLLVRMSTLEGVSDERRLMQLQLQQLGHYRGVADAMTLTMAQLSAFAAHLSGLLQQQEASRYVPPGLWPPHRWLQALRRRVSANSAQHLHGQHQQQQQRGPAQMLPPSAQQLAQQMRSAAAGAAAGGGSPFAAALGGKGIPLAPAGPAGAAAGGADADIASVGFSTLLSGLERQGSGASTYLFEPKTGWSQARDLLKREMDAGIGYYWWCVRQASKDMPVKVPRSREVMVLLFMWPICNGVLEACERIQASAQQALRARQHGMPRRPPQHAPVMPLWQRFIAWLLRVQQQPSQFQAQQPSMSAMPVGLSCLQQQAEDTSGDGNVSKQQQAQAVQPGQLKSWLRNQGHWALPLLRMLMVQPALLALHSALTQRLPAVLSSRAELRRLLSSRHFQAALKFYLATATTLVATVLLMEYVPAVRSSVPIFGFTTVCLTCQDRVEATVDKVAWRVLGTLLGAGCGLAILQLPAITHTPAAMLACMAAGSIALGLVARAQARTGIVLGLLTLCAVSLCFYESVCCSPGPHMTPMDLFLARVASVVGGCLYVALLARLLLPWYTTDFVLEQLAEALEQAALLFEQVYNSQHERMRLAELVAGAIKDEGADHNSSSAGGAGKDCQVAPPATQPAVSPSHSTQPVAGASTVAPAGPTRSAGCVVSWTGAVGVLQRHQCTDAGAASLATAAPSAQPMPALSAAAAAEQLAALEAAEAKLHVQLRQRVLGRLVSVQLLLARDSVSWRRGMLSTPLLVLDVLGAMNAVQEALASQRLALAPFTRHLAASTGADPAQQQDASRGMLHTMQHCYSLWAKPLHPLWLEIMQTVMDMTKATAAQLRRRQPRSTAARATAQSELLVLLQLLESRRLDLRHGWLDIRVRLHKAVHGVGQPLQAVSSRDGAGDAPFWPTDSVHLFTHTYGVSRCLNAFAAVTQAVVDSLN